MKKTAPPFRKFKVNLSKDRNEFIALRKGKALGKYVETNEKIKFQFHSTNFVQRVKFILNFLCDTSCEVNFRFCNADEMTQTNAQFRNKAYPTDVLSFPAPSEPSNFHDSSAGAYVVPYGDLLICLPVCALQAKTARITLAEELDRMIVHGLVHLRGFDHERSDASWIVMSGLEKLLRKELKKSLGPADWLVMK